MANHIVRPLGDSRQGGRDTRGVIRAGVVPDIPVGTVLPVAPLGGVAHFTEGQLTHPHRQAIVALMPSHGDDQMQDFTCAVILGLAFLDGQHYGAGHLQFAQNKLFRGIGRAECLAALSCGGVFLCLLCGIDAVSRGSNGHRQSNGSTHTD